MSGWRPGHRRHRPLRHTEWDLDPIFLLLMVAVLCLLLEECG